MPDQQITNPNNAYGYTDPTTNLPRHGMPMVNASSLTMTKGSAVCISTGNVIGSTQVAAFNNVGNLADNGVIGVLQTDVASGAQGFVVTEGVSLVTVSSGAIPAQKDQLSLSTVAGLSTSSNLFGLVKTTTGNALSSAAFPLPGTIIGTALSSTLDASSSSSVNSYILAYIKKV